MTDFSYSLERRRGQVFGHLAGDVDLVSAEALEAAIAAIEQASPDGDVILDMSEVTFLDSSGLRVLIATHDRHDAASRRLVIKEPASPVVRVLEITGLLARMNIET